MLQGKGVDGRDKPGYKWPVMTEEAPAMTNLTLSRDDAVLRCFAALA